MSMGEQWQKIKNFIGINNDDRYDYDDEYEYEDDEDYAEDVPPVAPTAAASEFHPRKVGGTSTMTQRPTAMKELLSNLRFLKILKASLINCVTCALY